MSCRRFIFPCSKSLSNFAMTVSIGFPPVRKIRAGIRSGFPGWRAIIQSGKAESYRSCFRDWGFPGAGKRSLSTRAVRIKASRGTAAFGQTRPPPASPHQALGDPNGWTGHASEQAFSEDEVRFALMYPAFL